MSIDPSQLLLPGTLLSCAKRKRKPKAQGAGGLVKKSNAFARAQWEADSLWEGRIVAVLIAKIKPGDPEATAYEIPVSELLRSDGGRDYREIERTIEGLMGRVITIRETDGSVDGKESWTKYTLFSKCRYNAGKATLELSFHPDLLPHYLNLQSHFTQYALAEYLELPSIYSQRMFDILKSWANCPQVQLPLHGNDGLHSMLSTTKSLQNNFKDFRRRVLDKAHDDINSKTSLRYEWYPIKNGRSVSDIVFVFSAAKRNAYIAENDKNKIRGERESKRAYFLEAVRCSEHKGGNCDNEDNKKYICNMCKEKDLCKGHYPSELLAVSVRSVKMAPAKRG